MTNRVKKYIVTSGAGGIIGWFTQPVWKIFITIPLMIVVAGAWEYYGVLEERRRLGVPKDFYEND